MVLQLPLRARTACVLPVQPRQLEPLSPGRSYASDCPGVEEDLAAAARADVALVALANPHSVPCSEESNSTDSCRVPKHATLEDDESKFRERYELLGTVLGSGASGSVVEARCRQTDKRVAVKTYQYSKMKSKDINNMRSEIDVHSGLSHPGVVQLEGVYETRSRTHVVMERLTGGELLDRMLDHGPLPEAEAIDITRQLLQILADLHAKRILHRDIKPENIMYAKRGCRKIKLIDFGYAIRLDSAAKPSAKCGTLRYVAPEVLRGQPYDDKVDIWSVGSVVYAMLTGRTLFGGDDDEVFLQNKEGRVKLCEDLLNSKSEEARSFLKSLLGVDPLARPSAVEALAHPWLDGAAAKKEAAPPASKPKIMGAAAEAAATAARRRRPQTAWQQGGLGRLGAVREASMKYMQVARDTWRMVDPAEQLALFPACASGAMDLSNHFPFARQAKQDRFGAADLIRRRHSSPMNSTATVAPARTARNFIEA